MALLESWKAFEETNGTPDDVDKVQKMFPIVSKKRRVDETGQVVEGKSTEIILSETFTNAAADWDMVFADDERESNPATFKFLQFAHQWAQAKKSGVAPSTVLPLASSRNIQEGEQASGPSNGSQDNDVGEADADDPGSDVASSQGDDD